MRISQRPRTQFTGTCSRKNDDGPHDGNQVPALQDRVDVLNAANDSVDETPHRGADVDADYDPAVAQFLHGLLLLNIECQRRTTASPEATTAMAATRNGGHWRMGVGGGRPWMQLEL